MRDGKKISGLLYLCDKRERERGEWCMYVDVNVD